MKRVEFKFLSVQNFLSIGAEPVEITFNKGVNIITGINRDKPDRRNGIGKSSVLDALFFAVFNESSRELKKDKLIHNVTNKGALIELQFDVEENGRKDRYKIVRALKPTKCQLFKNDEDVTKSTVSETDKEIEEIISGSTEIFKNCAIMSVNETVPFMAQKKVEKRKFIEGVFSLEVFSEVLKRARREWNSANTDHGDTNREITAVIDKMELIEEQIERSENELQDRKKRLKDRITAKKKEFKELSARVTEVDTSEYATCKEKIEALDAEIKEEDNKARAVYQNISNLSGQRSGLSSQVKSLERAKADCPTCKRPIEEESKKAILDNIEKLNGEMDGLMAEIKELRVKHEELDDAKASIVTAQREVIKVIDGITAQLNENRSIESQVKLVGREMNALAKEYVQLDDSKEDLTGEMRTKLKALRREKKDLGIQLDDQSKALEILDKVKFVVSEEGVKSFIVKSMLGIFNAKLAYYLSKMDANCQCTFNEYFEETIVNDTAKECSYHNFSGAERKNIDLACLFAFMDLRQMQGTAAYNVVMFDELLDSSLDEKGIELVLEILKERANERGEAIYVISHRKESVKIATGEIIFLEKRDRTTKRIDYIE